MVDGLSGLFLAKQWLSKEKQAKMQLSTLLVGREYVIYGMEFERCS
jgi:hypothetical protein